MNTVKPIFALPCNTKIDECAVCMDDISEMINITVTTCGHVFHSSCLIRCLTNNGDCPLCRNELIDSSEEEDVQETDEDEDEDEDDEGTDEDEDDDEEPECTVEKLEKKLQNMGITMADILMTFVYPLKNETPDKYTEENIDKIYEKVNGLLTGELSFATRDNRTYASVFHRSEGNAQDWLELRIL
jgi:hypothetical protein